MGNGRKKDTALWMVFVQGVALSLGVYLLVTVLATLLLVKAVLPEAGAFQVLAAGCCLSACLGGLTCTRRSPWGSLPSALVCAAGFLAVLIVVSLLCWKQISWLGRGGLLLLCGAGGGLLAGVLGGRRRRREGGKRVRPVRKKEKDRLGNSPKIQICPLAFGRLPLVWHLNRRGSGGGKYWGAAVFMSTTYCSFSVPKAAKERDAL